jgi:N6-L-threonylcarbamoyladenine synthase
MIILGIETSCDETSASIVENGTKILSNVVASSVELHQKTGGIIPEVAAREQLKCMVPVIQHTVQSAKCKVQNLDAIAVTNGPGLIGSLLVGVETAKTLAYAWEKPLIPINHLQAHLYANWLTAVDGRRKAEDRLPEFPAIGLVVSGGHTDLVLMKDHACPPKPWRRRGKIKWLGGTRDDAAGECFDKCARVLGLGYPGGPAISAAAEKLKTENRKLKTELPRPMINDNNYDFSFSGLKTAVINRVKEQEKKRVKMNVLEMAFEIQEAITDVLVAKTIRAAEKYRVKSILLAGGVVANSRLREKFSLSLSRSPALSLFVPPPKLCTDNAAYIAACAYFNQKFVSWEKVKVEPGLRIC